MSYTNYVWDAKTQRWINLSGNSSSVKIFYDTVSNWNMQSSMISERDTIYVYTDYQIIKDNLGNIISYVPNIKIGDGTSYLIDMPFVAGNDTVLADQLDEHIQNLTIHVSPMEKEFWNNKCRADDSKVDQETLILTTN